MTTTVLGATVMPRPPTMQPVIVTLIAVLVAVLLIAVAL